MKIYITRHGETNWNKEGRLQGQTDIELNEVGIEQAHIAKEKLKDIEIDLIISSPLSRAKKTAEIINEVKNVPIIIDERLIERGHGIFEGQCPREIGLDRSIFWDIEKNEEETENLKIFTDRIYSLLKEIEKRKEKVILLVCHAGVSIPIQAYYEGKDIADLKNISALKNCEIVKFEI